MDKKKRGGRKAQLSIFMVIAAVILISGIAWYVFLDAAELGVPKVPTEIAPLHTFIADCLRQSADSSLRQIGATGGYVNIPQSIDGDPSSYLQNGPFSTLRLPYWWHEGISSVPPLDFIAQEAERGTERNLITCLNNFSDFSALYDIREQAPPAIDIVFGEQETLVRATYPLEASTKANTSLFSLSEFEETLPIRFLSVYTLATTIMDRENTDEFIERKTIDLMSLDPKNIPVTDFALECEPKRWQEGEVRGRIQELLSANIPFIKIKGTPYSTTQYVPNPFGKETFENSYFGQHYVWDLGIEDFGGLRTGFSYEPRWPLLFVVRPSDNGVMSSTPQQGSEMLSAFCMQIFHFTYDLTFPIKVDVIDETPQQPYVFSFAFKASIDHNQPNRENFGFSLFDATETVVSQNYCANKDFETTILTVDNVTGESVKDVNLTFVCGRFSCPMGSTEWISLGAAAGKIERFPRCVNGIIKAEKPGYLPAQEFIQTESDGASHLLFLSPVKEINTIKVIKHQFSNTATQELLSASESASIHLTAESGYETFALSPSTAGKLSLLLDRDHTYHVSIRLITGEDASGGYEGEWTPTTAQLSGAEAITFHVVQSMIQNEDAQIDFINNLGANSKSLPVPELS